MEYSAQVANHAHRVAGVDEAGRGPLAGPVVAAAVILKDAGVAARVRDSKKISARKRETLFEEITQEAEAIGIGIVDAPDIDRMNILQATMLAMKMAIEKLGVKPTQVLVDGNRRPDCKFPTEAIIGGDSKIAEISAASIIAKVTRDRIMVELHREFPQYGFDVHKGYPTKHHREALVTHGPTRVHRRSFAPVRKVMDSVL